MVDHFQRREFGVEGHSLVSATPSPRPASPRFAPRGAAAVVEALRLMDDCC